MREGPFTASAINSRNDNATTGTRRYVREPVSERNEYGSSDCQS